MATQDPSCGHVARIRRHVVQSGTDIKKLLCHAASIAGANWQVLAGFGIVVMAVAALLHPNEMWRLGQFQGFKPGGGETLYRIVQ